MEYSIEKKKLTRPAPQPQTAKASPTPSAVGKSPAGKPAMGKPKKPDGRKYTEENIQRMLSEGYINVHPSLWDYIPPGAHVRYVTKDAGEVLPRAERFKPGGFVRNHFINNDGKKLLMIETRPGGKQGDTGYVSFPLAYKDVEELWKKYDRNAFIETHLIYSSLALKKRQIEDLESRVNNLEAALRKQNNSI